MADRSFSLRVPPEVWVRLQVLRGRRIQVERKELSTAETMLTALEAGMKVEEKRIEKAAGSS